MRVWRAQRLAELLEAVKLAPDPDSKKTDIGRARALLAKELRLTPAALVQQERRNRLRAEKAFREASEAPVDLRGMAVDDDYLMLVAQLVGHVESAYAKVQGALVHMQRIKAGLPMPTRVIEPVEDSLRVAMGNIAETLPVSLCPYCRAISGLVEQCDECSTSGLATAETIKQTPHVLLDNLTPKVFVNGKYELVTKYVEPEKVKEEEMDDVWL